MASLAGNGPGHLARQALASPPPSKSPPLSTSLRVLRLGHRCPKLVHASPCAHCTMCREPRQCGAARRATRSNQGHPTHQRSLPSPPHTPPLTSPQRTNDGSLEAHYYVGTGHHVMRVQNTVQVGLGG